MAEQTTISIGENTPEQVAFKLLEKIMNAEGVYEFGGKNGNTLKPADRSYILKTYAECLAAVRGHR